VFGVDRTGVWELQGGIQFTKDEYHHRHEKSASMRLVCVGKSSRIDNAYVISKN